MSHATLGVVARRKAIWLYHLVEGLSRPSAFPWRLERRIRVLTVEVDYVVVQS
jgi:hypothetical protein